MTTYHRDFYASASITDMKDGRARLRITSINGTVTKNSIHKNRRAALAAWYKYCN